MINIRSKREIEYLKEAGKVVYETHKYLEINNINFTVQCSTKYKQNKSNMTNHHQISTKSPNKLVQSSKNSKILTFKRLIPLGIRNPILTFVQRSNHFPSGTLHRTPPEGGKIKGELRAQQRNNYSLFGFTGFIFENKPAWLQFTK